ncbi:glutathione S-transferase family protein [Taklimakanibacter lacteus]|uniref:glutathione S-transferase family protein n=1 Tax=Taklimakanibacter lacteus TaxID=2268456 RepID=UPI0013C43809
MELHYIDGSPFARIVRVLACEHAVALREVEIGSFPPPERLLDINPLGQVPVLVADGVAYFPTRIAIEALLARVIEPGKGVATTIARRRAPARDDQDMAVILAMGDALAAHHYARWAGVGPVAENQLGFDPAQRNMTRALRTLDWLEKRMEEGCFQPGILSVQDIALACFILWTESRGPIAWRERPQIERLIGNLESRASFIATRPRPLKLRPAVG